MTSSNNQNWNSGNYVKNASFVAELGMPVVELLSAKAGERVLDLGCGDGRLSEKLTHMACQVVAVDASADMIKAAKARGLDAHVLDGQDLPFENEFDAVFSNAALHWMKEQQQVVAGVYRALKVGGRFVGEFGGYGNVATIVAALRSALIARGLSVPEPWYFPRVEEYQSLLESRGFKVVSIDTFARPTQLPGDVSGWLQTFAQPYTCLIAKQERQQFITQLVEELRASLCDDQGIWRADYVRLRFSAIKLKQ